MSPSQQTRTDYDVIVIGAGVAGALIAYRLAAAGARVVMLEAGDRGPGRAELVARYATASLRTPHSPYVSDDDKILSSPDS